MVQRHITNDNRAKRKLIPTFFFRTGSFHFFVCSLLAFDPVVKHQVYIGIDIRIDWFSHSYAMRLKFVHVRVFGRLPFVFHLPILCVCVCWTLVEWFHTKNQCNSVDFTLSDSHTASVSSKTTKLLFSFSRNENWMLMFGTFVLAHSYDVFSIKGMSKWIDDDDIE